MAGLLGNPKAIIPAFTLAAGLLAMGVIPAQGTSVEAASSHTVVAHYESSAAGGVLLRP